MDPCPIIDLFFPLAGRAIPLDHGYSLFAAISHCLETHEDRWLHDNTAVGIHPIRGTYAVPGRLALNDRARLGIRLRANDVSRWLPLAGRQITLGHDTVRIGVPQPRFLTPAPVLYAHLVTTRNGQDETRFDTEIARQLGELGVRGDVKRGRRHAFTVKDKRVVAHSLRVVGLSDEDSIHLQEQGLGGRRKLGCGIFVPAD